jgi:ArsR family transcriptional regulator
MQRTAPSPISLPEPRTGHEVRSGKPALPSMDMRPQAGQAAALLKVMANPDRLLLLCRLVDGECSVGELGTSAGIGQPTLSQQLGVLRGERLVSTRREGKQVIYRIASPAALTVLEALYGLFCDPVRTTSVVVKPERPAGAAAIRATRKAA